MKTLFPGYFAPTEDEFSALWEKAVFAFDASVLLGLYRSSSETQQVFFDVIDRIKDRIFLPHQAAGEYLKNRLGVISLRTDSYGKIKAESIKFIKFLELTIQEHALPSGEEIIAVAKGSAEKINELVSSAEKAEPDLLRSDDLLARLAELFGTKTGQPYERVRLTELYAEFAPRYAQGIPPGFKDDKKGESTKYGDALVWFQLIDQAKLTQKPIIFVTADLKEDWWLKHKGATLGPRPELRQEMMSAAGVQFYMYTTPRFLEFAKQYLSLNFDTKKAENEFEEIEKQDEQTANQLVGFAALSNSVNDEAWQNWNQPYFGGKLTNYPTASANSLYFTNVSGESTIDPSAAWFQPEYYGSGTGWVTAKPVDPEPKNKYFQLLPVDNHLFAASAGRWKCEIVRNPIQVGLDRIFYRLKFEPENRAGDPRYLELWVSDQRLHRDSDGRYKAGIYAIIVQWLCSDQIIGQITI